MKKVNLLLTFAVFTLAFISCEKNSDLLVENASIISSPVIVTDQALLDLRIEKVNKPVEFKGAGVVDLNYTWVANILPENSSGVTLSASTVDGYDDKIYVGWHARGPQTMGELSVVSMEDPENPAMVQYMSFMYQEFNDIEVKPEVSKLFGAGGAVANMAGESIGDNNAMAMSWDLDGSGELDGGVAWENYLPGYSANSITYVANQTLWVSKGSQGGLTVFRDYDLSQIKLDMEVSNAKHFDATGDYGVLLYGVGFNESVLRVWDMNSLYAPMTEYTIPYDVTPLGKNAVDINDHYAYLAMGNDGVVKVDLTDGTVVDRFDYDNGGFCNGVTVDWRWIYAAYGADGLFVIDKETFEVLGNWDFNGSCNYVKKVGDHLYLANGDVDGMIILKKD